MSRTRLSVEWLSGCSGCELGLVDLHEKLLEVLADVELVRMPILMDTKDYVEAEVGLVTGSVRTDHDVEAAKKMSAACGSVIALGTCPVYGGPHSSAYAHDRRELLDGAFGANPSTTTTTLPSDVPELLEGNLPLNAVIDVDLYIPGCPPHPAFIFEALRSVLEGREPTIGRHSVCFNCTRRMVKGDAAEIRSPVGADLDPEVCFLSQGCLCFGSVTLDRCMAPCPQVGVPCFSCGGPAEPVILEPQKDVRSEVAHRMAHLTRIPEEAVVTAIEAQAKTHFAYAMASPVFRHKPTFLLRKWTRAHQGASS